MKSLVLLFAVTLFASGLHGYPQQQSGSSSAGDVYEASAHQQAFYPSFPPFRTPPLGHSRPFVYSQPEAAYSQRPQGFNQQQQLAYDSSPRYSGYKDDSFRQDSPAHAILGSGNFGVIRGGTFYDNSNKETNEYHSERDFGEFFGNGHGRPFYGGGGGVPNPRPYQHEQFENFRDFADINTPTNAAYSEYVVVYVNKNGTREGEAVKRPKNIIESLAMLDVDEKEKKVSKSKAKLAMVLPEKKRRGRKQQAKEQEPLLALS